MPKQAGAPAEGLLESGRQQAAGKLQQSQQQKKQSKAMWGGVGAKSSSGAPSGSTENVSWMDIRVGDVVEIHNRESIPADIVLLSCSDPKGTCFVMTSNLDGETNLKPRILSPDVQAALSALVQLGGAGEKETQGVVVALAGKGASVECDLPNQKLDHFDGTLSVSGAKIAGREGSRTDRCLHLTIFGSDLYCLFTLARLNMVLMVNEHISPRSLRFYRFTVVACRKRAYVRTASLVRVYVPRSTPKLNTTLYVL